MKNEINSSIPVVFIHFGKLPEYLINALNQALSYNNKVYLLTDSNQDINYVESINIKQINADESKFKSYYTHMSTNTFQFEFICIYRWFILKNFMIKYRINRILYLDSDVYLYTNTSEMISNYPVFDFAYNLPENQSNYYWSGSACCSIWTINAIERFCDLIQHYYTTESIKTLQEKWSYHKENQILGGICDMTFLYFFSKEVGFLNLGKVYNSKSFDFNNASSDNYIKNEYLFKQGNKFQIPTKDIRFKEDLPNGMNLITGESVRFYALTEYAKLILYSRKISFFQKIKYTLYKLKKQLSNIH